MSSPAKLVLHYHCLNTSKAGLRADTDVGAAIFPTDTKNFSEATLVEFLEGFQMTT